MTAPNHYVEEVVALEDLPDWHERNPGWTPVRSEWRGNRLFVYYERVNKNV